MSEELTLLKERATAMGINYSPNIGVEALKAKIDNKLDDKPADNSETDDSTETPPIDHTVEKLTATQTMAKFRMQQRAEQLRLVRIRVTNLNPIKKDLRGEIFTVANGVLGTVRKFIPYGEATDNGYHVPFIIYSELKDRKFVSVKVRKAPNGNEVIEQRLVPEFALEELPALSPKELEQLARQQAAAAGTD